MIERYVKLAFNLPVERLFWYKVPSCYKGKLEKGQRTVAPFRKKRLIGFIVEISQKKPDGEIRELLEIVDTSSPLNENLLQLADWMSKYYCCSLGQTLHSIFPFNFPYKEKCPSNFSRSRRKIKRKNVYLIRPGGKKFKLILSEVKKNLERKRQTIILVPEIGLIPEFLEKIDNLKVETVVFHSKLSAKERFHSWLKMRKSKASVAIGTRSVVFAPFPQIGSIIIDQEESPDYKQKETPKYNVHEVAIKRGELERFPVILMSDAPSVESWYYAKRGDYVFFDFFKNSILSSFHIVDLKKEKRKNRIFSQFLQEKIRENLKKKFPIMLFVPRRGYASFILCQDCGNVIKCPNCDIGLKFHLKGKIICHYCGLESKAPSICPFCEGRNLKKIGWGTQRVEREIQKKFPEAKVARFDLDIFKSSPHLILEKIKKREVDILVGTQLLLKKEILSQIRLVGIILIDVLLNLPDFRASEHTFQLLVRIRKELGKESCLVVQTYNPDYFPLVWKNNGDFYFRELKIREHLGYPPYQRWIRIVFEGKVKKTVTEKAERIKEELERRKLSFLGPSPCPFPRIKGQYRYHIIIRKMKDNEHLKETIKEIISEVGKGSVKVGIDVDPLFII